MKINSLAFQTDLFFHRFTGIVFEYDDYLVVKTPTNPTYFWGNLIYFKNPPTSDSFQKWKAIFNDHFAGMNIGHMTFSWDSVMGESGSSQIFIEDGFNLDKSTVMVADTIIAPPKMNNDLEIRPIKHDHEWAMVIDNHVSCRALHFEEIPYRKFASRRIADYRLMVQKDKGEWMGAFFGDKLVGDLGIFAENGLGRFQTVGTHPDFRRMGVCSTLVYKTCLYGRDNMNIKEFVMVADPSYHAAGIYESVGFKPRETAVGLCKYNKERWVT